MSTDRPPAAPSEAPHMGHRPSVPEDAIKTGRTDDLPSYPDAVTGADTHGMGPERGSSTGPPGWVTVVVIVITGLVLLGFVVLHLSGGLGPGLHAGS